MILSDRDIRAAISSGKITIDPHPDLVDQLGSCSIDFHLGSTFKIFNHSKYPYIDPRSPNLTSELMKDISVADGEAFIMRPGEFCLATTVENLKLADDLLGRLEGRSSMGRIGIIVHSTAARFDPGWDGTPVLELGNIGVLPVALYPGMKICSFTFEELSSPSDNPYVKRHNAKYANQKSPEASRISQEMGNSETRYVKHGKKKVRL
ncbi:MAG TPA: dCTP deaminase [Candidatus Saccharimonadales bacterium]|nr:dCTP deaminase [Candidatus Saccharimonadales bacterium]